MRKVSVRICEKRTMALRANFVKPVVVTACAFILINSNSANPAIEIDYPIQRRY